jgi:hypothetical protein
MSGINKPRCLLAGCKHIVHVRGLCRSCYVLAGRLVREKRITWEILEANNKCLPATGRPAGADTKANWFLNGTSSEV